MSVTTAIYQFLSLIANAELYSNHLNIIGAIWAVTLTLFLYFRFKVNFQSYNVFPMQTKTRWHKALWFVIVFLFAIAVTLLMQYMIDDFITTPISLLFGSWSELNRGSFTFIKLLTFKWDVYASIIVFSLFFYMCGVWRLFKFTGISAVLLLMSICLTLTIASNHIWDYTAYSGTLRTEIFWLTYPEFRALTALFVISIVKQPRLSK